MTPQLTILKLLLDHANWERYGAMLVPGDFPEELEYPFLVLSKYHNEYVDDLSPADLGNLLYSNNPKKQELYTSLVNTLDSLKINEALTVDLIRKIKQAGVFRQLSLVAYEAAEGRASADDVAAVAASLEIEEAVPEDNPFVQGTLSELIEATYKQPGLRWRLPSLNKSLGSLRKGDFGFVFARPETGKTTFLASEVSYMAEQATGPVIWFNNEEQGDKVKIRVYQGSLGVEFHELSVQPEAKEKEYLEKTKGNICIVDRASLHKNFVEQVCKQYKPALIIFDQIDKITGFKADREDLMLGSIYIWARELAKRFCPVIGICQAGGEGENVRYLNMNHVANAKTAKQAEADWILGIGCLHDTGWENIRFLNISKNKLQGDVDTNPAMRHAKLEVLIRPESARYEDIK